MNTKETLDGIFQFRTDIQIPEWEFGYWYDTIERWYTEGMPKRRPPELSGEVQFICGDVCAWPDPFDGSAVGSADVHDYFELDEPIRSVPLNMGPLPGYEKRILDEDEENITMVRWDGKTVKTRRDGTAMPQFQRYPVTCRPEFERFKERFRPDLNARVGADLITLQEHYRNRVFPVQLGGSNFCGFYSVLRECMGVTETAYVLYDDPELIEEMLDFFTDYYIALYTQLLSRIDIDYILIWEDMCFKNGPLISPKMFKNICLPRYKRFIRAMRAQNVSRFIVDTDGNFDLLIDDFMEAGVGAIYPFEVAAGMDIEKTRERYPDLVIIGGIDKRMLAMGKEEIDIQIRLVDRMLQKGGFLPCVDHAVTPDVSFENYRYFRGEMKKVLKG